MLFKLEHKSVHSCCFFFLLYVVLFYKTDKIIKNQLQLHVWENTFVHLLEKFPHVFMNQGYSQQPLTAKTVQSKEQKTTFLYHQLNKLHVILSK